MRRGSAELPRVYVEVGAVKVCLLRVGFTVIKTRGSDAQHKALAL